MLSFENKSGYDYAQFLWFWRGITDETPVREIQLKELKTILETHAKKLAVKFYAGNICFEQTFDSFVIKQGKLFLYSNAIKEDLLYSETSISLCDGAKISVDKSGVIAIKMKYKSIAKLACIDSNNVIRYIG